MNNNLILVHTKKGGIVTITGHIGHDKVTRNYVGQSKPVAMSRFRQTLNLLSEKPTFQRTVNQASM